MPDGAAVHSCPLCGAPATDNGVAVDLNSNTAMIAGQPVRLTPRQAEVLSVFIGPTYRRNTRDKLIAKVWGHDADVDSNLVSATVCALNKRLKPFNYRVRSTMGRSAAGGYALERC